MNEKEQVLDSLIKENTSKEIDTTTKELNQIPKTQDLFDLKLGEELNNADFKVEAIKIIYDSVCVFRDKSGDSYKKMAKIVNDTLQLPPAQTSLAIAHIARTIKEKMGVTDWNKANEQQLKTRDSIHRDISLLCEAGIHPTKALEIVIKKY